MRISISKQAAAQLIVEIETGLHRLEGLKVVREATGDEVMWLDA